GRPIMNSRSARRAGGLLLVVAAVTVALTGRSLSTRAGDKGGKSPLEGKWTVTSMTQGGKTSEEMAGLLVFEIKGDRLTLSVFGKSQDASLKLHPSKTPKEFEMSRGGKPDLARGIYKLEKDTLTLCFAEGRDEARPTKFEAPAGKRIILLVLQRG